MLHILQRTVLVGLVELPVLAADRVHAFRSFGEASAIGVTARRPHLLAFPFWPAVRGTSQVPRQLQQRTLNGFVWCVCVVGSVLSTCPG